MHGNVTVSRSVNERNKTKNYTSDLQAGTLRRAAQKDTSVKKATFDPFARRETRPTKLWHTGKDLKLSDGAATAATASAAVAGAEKPDVNTNSTAVNGSGDDSGAVMTTSTSNNNSNNTVITQSRTMVDIRANVKKRLGFDPMELAAVDKRMRYLSKVSAGLPPLHSEARDLMRHPNISLMQALSMITSQNN